MDMCSSRVGATLVALVAALAATWSGAHPAPAAPACGEPPEIVGNTIYGTPCADTIRPPRSVTVVNGEGGDDTLFGGRGNDRLNGGAGDDRLYGGIGDDQLRGGDGDDLISGGFGADSVLDGQAGNDVVRGDATIDDIQNSGGGIDTLSYATGATPGFFDGSSQADYPDFSIYDGFPQARNGRGAYINLADERVDNGIAAEGGGVDEDVDTSSFEVVIGTAFADYIVGTGADQTFFGGGGADVIIGGGGDDTAYGGAEGDSCDAATTVECEFVGEEVDPRDPGTVSVGEMAPQADAPPALYLSGSSGPDTLIATYSNPAPGQFVVAFTANGGPAGTFTLDEPPDSVLLAGFGGGDSLSATGFPETTSVVLLGGDGGDALTGGDTEDALVDGDGDDTSDARGGDDALPNNPGDDALHAGTGEDLFVSRAVCDGDLLDGGPDRDNANWAQFTEAVTIDLRAGVAGRVGPEGEAQCSSPEQLTDLVGLEDIEGSGGADVLVGDTANNQLLGRLGADSYFALAGNDSILANSGTPFDDPDPTIDCGEGLEDLAQIDRPENGPDEVPIDCEEVEERDPNSFRPPSTPTDPTPEPAPPPVVEPVLISPPPLPKRPPRPPRDTRGPQTRILSGPRGLLISRSRLRRVVVRFASSEAGSRFRCRVDRRRAFRCRSPRRFTVGLGRHVIRVFAIDAAGNRDPSPAVLRFRVRRR